MLSLKGTVQRDGSGCSKVHLIGGAKVFRKVAPSPILLAMEP